MKSNLIVFYMFIAISFSTMNAFSHTIKITDEKSEDEKIEEKEDIKEQAIEKIGTPKIYFEKVDPFSDELIPHLRSPGNSYSDFEDYTLDPAIAGHPEAFFTIFGAKACKYLKFEFGVKESGEYYFMRMPSARRICEILSKTKTYRDRVFRCKGLVNAKAFLKALEKGGVYWTEGESPFLGNMKEIESLGLKREQLALLYMVHDMWNHCIQVVLPKAQRQRLAKNAHNLLVFAKDVEIGTHESDAMRKLLGIWLDSVVAILDQKHGSLTNVLAGFFTAGEEDFVESVDRLVDILKGLFFGYDKKVEKLVKKLHLKGYSRPKSMINKNARQVGFLTPAQVFMNLVIYGLVHANEDHNFDTSLLFEFNEWALKFAQTLSQDQLWQVDVYEFVEQVEEEQLLLAREIKEVLRPIEGPIELVDPGRNAPPLPLLVELPQPFIFGPHVTLEWPKNFQLY